MFFQTKETLNTIDTYDQAKILITALLHHECPEHSPKHHLLYTTNQKLEAYREAKEYFRKQIDVQSAIGIFSSQSYDAASAKYNQLYLLIRAYMHLADDGKRHYFNHHLTFHQQKIATLFDYHKEQQHVTHLLGIEHGFWAALKEDIVPLFTQIE